MRPAFVDTQFVKPDIGDDGVKTLYRIAQGRNPKLIPTATVSDLFNPIFRAFLAPSRPRLGVYVPYADVDPALLLEGLKVVGCDPADAVIFIDFTGADLNPTIAPGSVAAIFDQLNEAAVWARLVFQGSAYPKKNPADAGGYALVPRDEWKTFNAAAREWSLPKGVAAYGDFGAHCGEMVFPKGPSGRAILHLRYTTPELTLVVRGKKEGKDLAVMRDVFQRILDSGHFAGQSFSYADDRIWRGAKGLDGSGNASIWREWNMAHHITRLVRDLGAMEGIFFHDGRVSMAPEQVRLFEDF